MIKFHKLSSIRNFESICFRFKEFNSIEIQNTFNDSRYQENSKIEVYLKFEDYKQFKAKHWYLNLITNSDLMQELPKNIAVKSSPKIHYELNNIPFVEDNEGFFLILIFDKHNYSGLYQKCLEKIIYEYVKFLDVDFKVYLLQNKKMILSEKFT